MLNNLIEHNFLNNTIKLNKPQCHSLKQEDYIDFILTSIAEFPG